jgi:uncharacterized protein (TIGR02271 family)
MREFYRIRWPVRRIPRRPGSLEWQTECFSLKVPQPVLVSGKDGWRGIVHSWSGGSRDGPEGADEITIRLDTGEKLIIPGSILARQPDGSWHVPLSVDELHGGATAATDSSRLVIPVIHEELEIGKRTVETGSGVRVHKSARNEQQTVDVPLIQEQVEVERVPVDRTLDGPVPVRHVGDTIIVPVMQEVLVVQKQLRLVEELHIRKVRTEKHQPQTVTLQKEEVTVERLEGDSRRPWRE